MFIEIIQPRLIDIYRSGTAGSTEPRVKIRLDETGKVTPLTLNLVFKTDEEAAEFAMSLIRKLEVKMYGTHTGPDHV